MAKSKSDAVLLRGEPNTIQREAAGAITPGHLLTLGSGDTVVAHSTAGGRHARMFALDQPFMGDDLSVAYASGEAVQIHMARPGDVINALIANGQNIAIGDFLESAGDGTLRENTALSTNDFEGSAVGMALQACDMSGSSGVDPTPRCQVLVY